jgi:hypothetical protein
VFNQGADASRALQAMKALPLPGALVNGYALGGAGLEWSAA